MPAPHTIQEMHKIAALHGGRCLSKEYIDQHSPLKWMCEKGHTFDMDYKIIHQGAWCMQCAGGNKKQNRLDVLNEIAAQHGGKLLSTDYKNSELALLWQCKERHEWKASAHYIIRGKWCPRCAGVVRYTIADMQLFAAKKGGKCLSAEYFSVETKLQWQCSEGHVWMAKPNTILRGSWCRKCAVKRVHEKQKNDIERYRKIAAERGGKLLSGVYINSSTPLQWKCAKEHIWMTAPSSVENGSWCPYCAGKAKHTLRDMQKFAVTRGGKCLSRKYINMKTKLEWECAEGHRWMAEGSNVYHNGAWCKFCYSKICVKNLGAYAMLHL
jgi:hypothetical protein